MVLQKVGETATEIQVNGTTEGNFTQVNDSVYDVSVSGEPNFNRKDVVTFYIGGDEGFDTVAWDVFNGNGDKIDEVSVQVPSGSGADVRTKVYTDEGNVSFNKTSFSTADHGINRVVIEPTATATTNSVTKL